MDQQNRREFTRISMDLVARLKQGEQVFEGVTRDLSANGALVEGNFLVEAGRPCELDLSFGDAVRIQASGTIVRTWDGQVAVAFSSVDLEGFEHLRNLVLFNSDDPDAVNREFVSHQGLKRR